MFKLEDIQKAHAKVKSGADFPGYIQDLKKLGVIRYETFVDDGHTIYSGENNSQVESPPKYAKLKVQAKSQPEKFLEGLKIHQHGQTNYPTFCRHSAETGVEKWTVDIGRMTCTYFDKSGNQMLEEKIPQA